MVVVTIEERVDRRASVVSRRLDRLQRLLEFHDDIGIPAVRVG